MNNELTTVAEEALDELRGRFLTFYIDDTFYSIELCHIIEIISIQPTTYVPGLPDYFKEHIKIVEKDLRRGCRIKNSPTLWQGFMPVSYTHLLQSEHVL